MRIIPIIKGQIELKTTKNLLKLESEVLQKQIYII
jgi:hypothetical protein